MRFTRSLLVVFLLACLWASSALATVTTTFLKSGPYNTDGATTVFSVVFEYIADTDITANIVNTTTGTITTLTINTDFTVTDGLPLSDGTFSGGSITILANAGGSIANGSGQFPSGYQLTILRNMALKQPKSYPQNGAFPSAATEQALDRVTLLTQQIQNQLNGAIQVPTSDNGLTVTLPAAAARANKFLGFDASGNVITTAGTGGLTSIVAAAPFSTSLAGTVLTLTLPGPVGVPAGGTGLASVTANSLLFGNGVGALSTLGIGSNGTCLIVTAGAPVWGSCSGTSLLTLGTSAAATNPQRSGQAGTGMYSDTTNVVEVAAGGIAAAKFNTLASGVDFVTVTPGKSGTVPIISVGGSTSNQGLNIAAAGSGAVQISGVAQPTSVSNNNIMASTASAVVNETLSLAIDNALGSTRGSIITRQSAGWAILTPGTAGNVLTSGGAGADPTYSLPASTIDIQTFTSSGTWTAPANAHVVYVQCVGGGGSGASGVGAGSGGGGGAGYMAAWFKAATAGASQTVTVGAGGASPAANNSGNNGSNTTFGALLTAYAGAGGGGGGPGGGGGGALSAGCTVVAATQTSGCGGSPQGGVSSGSVNGGDSGFGGGGGGGSGSNGIGGNAVYGGGGGGLSSGSPGSAAGGQSIFGGGGGGGLNGSTGDLGGTSLYGGAGGRAPSTRSGNGTAGTQPGGGGGAGGLSAGNVGGAGAAGQCIIETW